MTVFISKFDFISLFLKKFSCFQLEYLGRGGERRALTHFKYWGTRARAAPCREWLPSGKFGVLRPEGRRFESHCRRHGTYRPWASPSLVVARSASAC